MSRDYDICKGVIVIPKSTHYEAMAENFDVFDFKLDTKDMAKITLLKKTHFPFDMPLPWLNSL